MYCQQNMVNVHYQSFQMFQDFKLWSIFGVKSFRQEIVSHSAYGFIRLQIHSLDYSFTIRKGRTVGSLLVFSSLEIKMTTRRKKSEISELRQCM